MCACVCVCDMHIICILGLFLNGTNSIENTFCCACEHIGLLLVEDRSMVGKDVEGVREEGERGRERERERGREREREREREGISI